MREVHIYVALTVCQARSEAGSHDARIVLLLSSFIDVETEAQRGQVTARGHTASKWEIRNHASNCADLPRELPKADLREEAILRPLACKASLPGPDTTLSPGRSTLATGLCSARHRAFAHTPGTLSLSPSPPPCLPASPPFHLFDTELKSYFSVVFQRPCHSRKASPARLPRAAPRGWAGHVLHTGLIAMVDASDLNVLSYSCPSGGNKGCRAALPNRTSCNDRNF